MTPAYSPRARPSLPTLQMLREGDIEAALEISDVDSREFQQQRQEFLHEYYGYDKNFSE